VTATVIRTALALFFVLAGVTKLANRVGFIGALAAYRFIPKKAFPFISIAVPLGEGIIGACLLQQRFAQWSAIGAVVLLTMFSGVVAAGILKGLSGKPCGCGTPRWLGSCIGWRVVARNGILASLVLWSSGLHGPFLQITLLAVLLSSGLWVVEFALGKKRSAQTKAESREDPMMAS
jgi:hypothetical protein